MSTLLTVAKVMYVENKEPVEMMACRSQGNLEHIGYLKKQRSRR